MEEKLYERVLRCTRQGAVSVNGALLQLMIEECEKEVNNTRSVERKLQIYLNMAAVCSSSGYPYSAIRLYQKVKDLSIKTDYQNNRMRYQKYAFQAAHALESEWRRYAPHEKRPEHLKEVMLCYEDLYFLVHNIE